jgi:hypothetical protein
MDKVSSRPIFDDKKMRALHKEGALEAVSSVIGENPWEITESFTLTEEWVEWMKGALKSYEESGTEIKPGADLNVERRLSLDAFKQLKELLTSEESTVQQKAAAEYLLGVSLKTLTVR